MLKRIRDLDLDAIVEAVLRATDVARGRACDGLIQEGLDQSRTPELRIASLRNYMVLAAMRNVAGPEEMRIEQPLVEAFVRTHHHPAAPQELPTFTYGGKAPARARFVELSNAHPDLGWDKQIVKALLWRAIQSNGDHELDDASPPWKMYWGPSHGAAYALISFVTYEAFGSLEGTDPAAEAARRQLEQQTVDLAKQVRDGIDRYDDPDVAAQREAYERAKAERIGAQLASFYVKTGQRDGNEPLDHAITKMLQYFAHWVDAEVPDVGDAPTIDQPLPTLDAGALVWLDMVSVSSARELVLRIKSPDGKTTKSLPLLQGTKLRLVTYLEAPSTPKVIIAAIDELNQHEGRPVPMRKRIRDLHLHKFAIEVVCATDVLGRTACTPKVDEWLENNPTSEQRLALLRNCIGIAAMKSVATPDELRIDQPAVEAFIRTHHHPATPREVPDHYVFNKGLGGPRFEQLAGQHPDLQWDKSLVRSLLWTAIQANGDHELDDSSPPWRMDWGPSAMAAQALIIFLTLETMGALDGPE